jgi:hypothetical protein
MPAVACSAVMAFGPGAAFGMRATWVATSANKTESLSKQVDRVAVGLLPSRGRGGTRGWELKSMVRQVKLSLL